MTTRYWIIKAIDPNGDEVFVSEDGEPLEFTSLAYALDACNKIAMGNIHKLDPLQHWDYPLPNPIETSIWELTKIS